MFSIPLMFVCLAMFYVGLMLWETPPSDSVATIQKSIESASKSIETIGGQVGDLTGNVEDHDGKIIEIGKSIAGVQDELKTTKSALDAHITATKDALKAVHAGGHDRPPVPFRTRVVNGFEFSDIEVAKSFGLWIMARCCHEDPVRSRCHKALEKMANKGPNGWAEEAYKALEEGQFAQGGALVPSAYLADLIRNVETHGHFGQNAARIPMTAATVTIPRDTQELTVYYPEENSNITESNAAFGDVTLTSRLYATLSKWSNTLAEDVAIEFGSYMAEKISFSHAKARDTNGFLGDGTSTYARVTGALNVSNVVTHILGNATGASLTNTGKDTFGELAYADLCSMQGLLPTKSRAGAKWYMHRYIAAIIDGLVTTTGAPVISYGIDNRTRKRMKMLLGDPVVEVDVMPSTSAVTTDFILYGDLSLGMAMGERRQMRVANSQEAGFAADQTWVRSTARVAIAELDGTQLVKARTSTT